MKVFFYNLKGGENIKKHIIFTLMLFITLISISSVNAMDDLNQTSVENQNEILSTTDNDISHDLEDKIINAKNNDEILIEPGTYALHNIQVTKNITLQGNGNPRDIIIDGENKSSIFLIRSPDVYVTFKNITFINGKTDNFGGAISIETGNVYVDNCIFANNTATSNTNAGGISNYGTKEHRGYLLVNNSLFINNHADHDGGAITTHYGNSYIYNSVFINNSAHRDGGAIRVSVYGYGNVEDCIFMYNHADEWGGAYYSWSGESNINRCIFMNNTAGTNGGGVMVSGDITLQNSIIMNNDGGETGGSFYIQQPMYDKKTVMNVNNNLITNNTSPNGKEIFIKWWDAYNLYPNFNNNDWGDEDPNDSKINDPNNVTSRIKVSKTTKSNLMDVLNFALLKRYEDIIGDYFPEGYLDNIKENSNPSSNENTDKPVNSNKTENLDSDVVISTSTNNTDNNIINQNAANSNHVSDKLQIAGNSTSFGDSKKAYELNESKSVSKVITNSNFEYLIAITLIVFVLLVIGYKRQNKNSE